MAEPAADSPPIARRPSQRAKFSRFKKQYTFRYPTPPEDHGVNLAGKDASIPTSAILTVSHIDDFAQEPASSLPDNSSLATQHDLQPSPRMSLRSKKRASVGTHGAIALEKPRSRKKTAVKAPRKSASLCATHPAMYTDAAKPSQPLPKQHAKKTTSSSHRKVAAPPSRTTTTARPVSAVQAEPFHTAGRIIDPTAQTHSSSGLPPLWTSSAMMSKTDYDTSIGIVLSPTFMIGLPCGGLIELAELHPPA